MDKLKFKGKAPADIAEIIYRMAVRQEATVHPDGKHQTSEGRSRSRVDMKKVANHYFPKQADKMAECLKKLVDSGVLSCNMCYTINRLVYGPQSYAAATIGRIRDIIKPIAGEPKPKKIKALATGNNLPDFDNLAKNVRNKKILKKIL